MKTLKQDTDKNNPPRLVVSCFSALMFFFLLFSFLPTANALTDATVYYSFEDFVTTYTTDNSGNGYSGLVSDTLNIPSSQAKIGNWAAKFEEGDKITNLTFTTFDDKDTPISFSVWAYIPDPLVGSREHPFLSFGADPDGTRGHFLYAINTEFRYQNCYSLAPGRCYGIRTTNTTSVTFDTWNHFVIVSEGVVNNQDNTRMYINNVEYDTTVFANSYNAGLEDYGNGFYVGNVTRNALVPNQETVYVDDVAVYSRALSVSEITALYNDGQGQNPFDPQPPQQVASIGVINLGTQTDQLVDFGDFFINEEWTELYFEYDLASYFVNNSEGFTYVNTGDFAVQAISDTEYRFYSFTAQVQQVPMNLTVCNNLDCVTTSVFFAVEGFGAPQQIASVADWNIKTNSQASRTFSDYFQAYTRPFFQFTDPDDGVTLVNVTVGQPSVNSCFEASVTGDVLTIVTIDNECSLQARFVVDDTQTAAFGNYFTLTVDASVTPEEGNFFTESFFSLYPPEGELSNRTKLFVVLAHFFVLFAAAIFIRAETPGSSSDKFLGVVVSVVTVLLLFFFTSLGYIPIWIVLVVAMIALLTGVSVFRRGVVG